MESPKSWLIGTFIDIAIDFAYKNDVQQYQYRCCSIEFHNGKTGPSWTPALSPVRWTLHRISPVITVAPLQATHTD